MKGEGKGGIGTSTDKAGGKEDGGRVEEGGRRDGKGRE